MFQKGVSGGFIVIGCATVYLAIHTPLVLVLTVKTQEKSKKHVPTVKTSSVFPPQGLQFHGEEHEMTSVVTIRNSKNEPGDHDKPDETDRDSKYEMEQKSNNIK